MLLRRSRAENPNIHIGDRNINISDRSRNLDGDNLYRRPDNRARVAESDRLQNRDQTQVAQRRENIQNNVFADRDGNVFRRGENGWERRDGSGWNRSETPRPATRESQTRPAISSERARPSTGQAGGARPRPSTPTAAISAEIFSSFINGKL